MDAAGWIAHVRKHVDGRLASYFDVKRRETKELSPESLLLVEGVEALTMRGGKRLRPVVLAAAYRAVAGEREGTPWVDVGASLELLQSYLLIHDDWMDQDDERRGGPSVHAAFRGKLGTPHLANALAVLAGDLASTYAWELFFATPWPGHRIAEANRAYLQIHKEVFFGQQLDLMGSADVSRMHQLKTGSYTVRGPLSLGAILGDGSAEAIAALAKYGEPLGEAFQLRDDVLGTFGDTETTGKPSGNDLRAGKRTSLVAEAEASLATADREALTAVLGKSDASDEEVSRAASLLVESGAKARVEARLAERLAQARDALSVAPLDADGKALLLAIADQLAIRNS